MNPTAQQHPSFPQLAAYGLGKLDDRPAQDLEEHLSGCEQCARRLKELPDDSLVVLLREHEAAGDLDTSPPGETPTMLPPHEQATLPPDGQTRVSPGPANVQTPRELVGHSRYEIIAHLGGGGMGQVYKAQHRIMNRPVALKVINPELMNHPGAVERFHREIQAASRLLHANIVTAHDADQAGELHFFVMEYVDGADLHRLIQERGPLPVREACEYIRQAALGLQHAYEQGMVHRDIKPHNLMLAGVRNAEFGMRNDESDAKHSASRTPHSALVKILDFGLANFASETAAGDVEDSHPAQRAPAADVLRQLTQMGTMMGTPDYIAPEQAEDAHAADIRADIYSLGCTFYTLLTGRAPFGEGSVLEKIKAHSEHDPPPLAESRNDVPPEVEHILMTMMAKDPAERYQSPAEVAEALRHFIDQRIEEKLHERRFDYAPPRKPTSAPATFITCGVIAAVLLCVLFLGLGAAAWFSYWSLERSDFHAGSNRPATLAAKAPSEADRMSLVQTFEAHQSPISSLAAAGDLLVSGAGDGKARVWSVKTGGVLHVLDGHQRERGVAVDINREATRVVTGDRAGRVWIWDLGKAKSIADVHAHDDGLYSVAFSPDGTKILSAGCDNTARVWGSATGEQLQVLRGHKWWVCDAAFSPDGRQAVTVSFDESARVWDIETGQEVLKLDAQNEPQFCVAWSRDGRYIANGLRNNLVRMYNAATGKEVRSFAGHADRVQDVAFSADDRWLFTGAYDRTLRVWNVETGEEVAQVSHGNHIFNTLAVLPDGRHIVSGGGLWKPVESENRWENEFDHAIRLWRLPEYLLPEAPESSAESAASGASAPADGDAAAPSGSRFVE